MSACRTKNRTPPTFLRRNGPSSLPTSPCWSAKTRPSAPTTCATSSTPCAVDRAGRSAVADDAPRLPTMGGGLPADKEVDRRRGLRSDGPRPPARGAALGPREGSGALPWAVLESPTLRSTPESGARGGYDGAKRKKGSKVHAAVDTLGHLLALR